MSEVKRFVKKPIIIDAVQWTGDNLQEVINFTGLHPSANKWSWKEYEQIVKTDGLKIFTLEGKMGADVYDWIIKGVNGEFYPCKPDIFQKTYMLESDYTAKEAECERLTEYNAMIKDELNQVKNITKTLEDRIIKREAECESLKKILKETDDLRIKNLNYSEKVLKELKNITALNKTLLDDLHKIYKEWVVYDDWPYDDIWEHMEQAKEMMK